MFLFGFLLLHLLISSNSGDENLNGHLKPLGSQIAPIGDVLAIDEVPSPEEFFYKYVQPGKPVLFKGAALNSPAYEKWTDEYMRKKFGGLKFDVEEGKKENRSKELFNMPLSDFLNSYKSKDIYMVASLPKAMSEDVYLLKCLLCGGFTNEIQDSVMWFSNGGTKSVLHFDAIDNINCLMSGTKELFMVDKREHKHILVDNPSGSFSNVDVDKVDLKKYSGLADVPWYKAFMKPGDCLYIPYRWFHQVRSYGPRNLAINIWFAHRLKFNATDCQKKAADEFASLSQFEVNELIGPNLRLLVIDEMEDKSVNTQQFIQIMQNVWRSEKIAQEGRQVLEKTFTEMDIDKDYLLSPKEVMDAPMEEIEQKLLKLFPVDDDEEEDEERRNEDEDDERRNEDEDDERRNEDEDGERRNEDEDGERRNEDEDDERRNEDEDDERRNEDEDDERRKEKKKTGENNKGHSEIDQRNDDSQEANDNEDISAANGNEKSSRINIKHTDL
ncbi:uncharacterized protein LOC124452390 isoform X2 [Xenia sp. Carnegie-2017]|nr:uncharacterized protein LOC124452390 isoform X2 [Xenia sp. Carnegie-2017]